MKKSEVEQIECKNCLEGLRFEKAMRPIKDRIQATGKYKGNNRLLSPPSMTQYSAPMNDKIGEASINKICKMLDMLEESGEHVPTLDYLFGRSDVNIDARDDYYTKACNETGLSAHSISALLYLHEKHKEKEADLINDMTIKFINHVLEDVYQAIEYTKKNRCDDLQEGEPFTSFFSNVWEYINGFTNPYNEDRPNTVDTAIPSMMTQSELIRAVQKMRIDEYLQHEVDSFKQKAIEEGREIR